MRLGGKWRCVGDGGWSSCRVLERAGVRHRLMVTARRLAPLTTGTARANESTIESLENIHSVVHVK